MSMSQEQTMTSIEFRKMVNEARKLAGESEVRNIEKLTSEGII